MIMTETHNLLTKRSGRLLIVTILFVLIASMLFSGCSEELLTRFFGNPTGDWDLELLNDYYLIRVNSHCKKIARSTEYSDKYVIRDNLYVTDYQVSDPYIYVCGIRTRESFISDEELTTNYRWYYLVDTVSGEVSGPFDSKESFEDFLTQSEIEILEEWIVVPK